MQKYLRTKKEAGKSKSRRAGEAFREKATDLAAFLREL